MTFENEWAQHKAAAASRQDSASMQLDEADGAGGGSASGAKGMASSAADKKKAAKYLEEDLLPDAVKAGKHAGGTTQSVTGTAPAGRADAAVFGGPGELDKWEIRTGLHKATQRWGQQVNNVLARLSGEMEALRAAKGLYTGNDAEVYSEINDLIPPDEPGSGVNKKTPSLVTLPDPPVSGGGGPDGTGGANSPLSTNPPTSPR